jgi:hypothetical protein
VPEGVHDSNAIETVRFTIVLAALGGVGPDSEGPMHPIRLDQLSAAGHAESNHASRAAKHGRLRIRARIALFAGEWRRG